MSAYVARTCTEVGAANASALLESFRGRSAYVLLGDPGSGKTTEFQREQAALGDAAAYVSARDFMAFSVDTRPEWRGKILFIDGLDEVRAGATDMRSSLDEVRSRLDQLGRPVFRLSCREADWLGGNDLRSLEAVFPDSQVAVLRLDPLNDNDIAEMLGGHPGTNNAQNFIDQAKLRGLSGLLGNPQTLMLLVGAVMHSGDWPDSRRETFETACRQMATERNQEHLIGAGVLPEGAVLDAAGYLCSLHLLADVGGFSTSPTAYSGSLAPIHWLEEAPALPPGASMEQAMRTRLFAVSGEHGHRPAHRHLAEFLAGRYLAKLIGDGLPVARVVALLTRPADHRVATPLRGLSAWLASHSLSARDVLIDADPVGVGLYGDIGSFSVDEKKRLLESLARFASSGPLLGHEQRDGRVDDYRDTTAWAFRSLVSADTVPAMKAVIADPSRADDKHRMVEFVLTLLADTESSVLHQFDDIGAAIETMVRDPRQPPYARRLALDVYLPMMADQDPQAVAVHRLLNDIRVGSVSDPDDDLCGTLLRRLYPNHLPPSQIWGYALSRNRRNYLGRFAAFWHWGLLEQSSDQHVAELLDSLSEDSSQITSALEQAGFEDLPLQLLCRGIEAWGDGLESSRLYRWLNAPKRSQTSGRPLAGGTDPALRIKEWLEARPGAQKSVFLMWVRQSKASESLEMDWAWGCNALHWSRLPDGFGLWCLETALELADSEPLVSKEIFWQAYRSLDSPDISEGLTLEHLEEQTRGNAGLAALLERWLNPPPPRKEHLEWEHERQERMAEYERSKRQKQCEWAEVVRSQAVALTENRAAPQLLHNLAMAYFALFVEVDRHARPQDRIREFLCGDVELAEVVLTALRQAAFRDDLPEVDRTISLHSESRHHFLAYPVLASLDLCPEERLDTLSHAQKGKILAIRYCAADTPTQEATTPCHDRWLHQSPELVFDLLYRCAVAALKAGETHLPGLFDLDRLERQHTGDKGTRTELLRRVNETRVRLLRAFPVRAPGSQLSLLDRLAGQALRYTDRAALAAVVEKKLRAKSATDAQKVRWLTAGALLSPSMHRDALREFTAGNDERTRHVAEFLRGSSDVGFMGSSIMGLWSDPALLRDVIALLGRLYKPQSPDGFVTLEVDASDQIFRMVSLLGAMSSQEAQEALSSLAANPQLADWHAYIEHISEGQSVLVGDASYELPTIEQVQATLSNALPANAADLAALVVERLRDLSPRLQGDSNNLWRQFWNEDSHGRPIDPKPENSCRDAVLALLQSSLPPGVDAAPEGRYAAGARADIRVSYGGNSIPIELKKNAHPDLWTAHRHQLISQYTTDPATGGYGVYLLLWFGGEGRQPAPPPSAPRPTTAEELQQRLEQDLTPEEARKIFTVVFDVTKPN